jgi:hypothetical protein
MHFWYDLLNNGNLSEISKNANISIIRIIPNKLEERKSGREKNQNFLSKTEFNFKSS